MMILPRKLESLDHRSMATICENLCLHLKERYPNFEMFLMEPEKRKCTKYRSLEKLVFSYVKDQWTSKPLASASTEDATTLQSGL